MTRYSGNEGQLSGKAFDIKAHGGTAPVDHVIAPLVLPHGERFALDDVDLERIGKYAPHLGPFHPVDILQKPLRPRLVEAEKRASRLNAERRQHPLGRLPLQPADADSLGGVSEHGCNSRKQRLLAARHFHVPALHQSQADRCEQKKATEGSGEGAHRQPVSPMPQTGMEPALAAVVAGNGELPHLVTG